DPPADEGGAQHVVEACDTLRLGGAHHRPAPATSASFGLAGARHAHRPALGGIGLPGGHQPVVNLLAQVLHGLGDVGVAKLRADGVDVIAAVRGLDRLAARYGVHRHALVDAVPTDNHIRQY